MLSFKNFVLEYLEESKDRGRQIRDRMNIQKKGRYKIVKARIRGNKIQRTKKVSSIKGYEFKNKKLVRMSSIEKRNRKIGQRRAKIKRKMEIKRSLIRRKMSLRRRHSIGL